jgi:hypothetical protein
MAYAKLVGIKWQISKFYVITLYFKNKRSSYRGEYFLSLYIKIFTYCTCFVGNFI